MTQDNPKKKTKRRGRKKGSSNYTTRVRRGEGIMVDGKYMAFKQSHVKITAEANSYDQWVKHYEKYQKEFNEVWTDSMSGHYHFLTEPLPDSTEKALGCAVESLDKVLEQCKNGSRGEVAQKSYEEAVKKHDRKDVSFWQKLSTWLNSGQW